jgi:hypothetical protein
MPDVIRLTIDRIAGALPNRWRTLPPVPPAQFANQTFENLGMRNGTKPLTSERTP